MDSYKTVTQLLAQHLGCDASEFTLETDLERLGIDSLENIEIIMELEDILDMDFFPEKLPVTVGDLVKLLPSD